MEPLLFPALPVMVRATSPATAHSGPFVLEFKCDTCNGNGNLEVCPPLPDFPR